MYCLTRYVVWEVLKYFLTALAALTLVFTIGMTKRAADEWHLPFSLVIRIMPFILPEVLGITIPVAMLYSVSSVFGRMTGSNEVVALKSLGISPMAVVWPVLVLAAFCSVGTIWMYELAATRCRPTVDRIATESVEEIVYSMLQRNRSCDFGQFSITVKEVDGRKLARPKITIRGMPGQPQVLLTAAEAEIKTDWKTRVLHLICRDGEVDIDRGKMVWSFPGVQEWPVPIAAPISSRYHRDRVATRDIPNLIEELKNEQRTLQAEVRQLETLRAANKALGVFESPKDAEAIVAKKAKIVADNFLILRLRAEPYRRWSNGFTCLFFALLGASAAMLWRHADVLTNFFVCFLPILAVYYPLLMLSDKLSTSGAFPPVSFWLGNAVLSIPGVLLLRWTIRH
ncbi:MAG: LptF/LptG family permease [Planctomycetaceae bacterium]|nr:LptF/LptG family permease [Planctomycetaceae bacterium]